MQHLQQEFVKIGAVGDRDRTAGATAAAAPGRGAAPTAGQCQGRSSWRQGQNSRSNSCSCSRERCSTYSRTVETRPSSRRTAAAAPERVATPAPGAVVDRFISGGAKLQLLLGEMQYFRALGSVGAARQE